MSFSAGAALGSARASRNPGGERDSNEYWARPTDAFSEWPEPPDGKIRTIVTVFSPGDPSGRPNRANHRNILADLRAGKPQFPLRGAPVSNSTMRCSGSHLCK